MRHRIHYLVLALLLMVGCLGRRQPITTSSVLFVLDVAEQPVSMSAAASKLKFFIGTP